MSERDEASKDRAGLYVHFPFCREKCPYCHFASVPYHKEIADIWRKGLAREARFYYPQDFIFDSLYFGGGTPSLLSPAEVLGVREILNKNFRLEINEFTLEANPDIKDPDILWGWRESGVTRLSIGVQSFDNRLLKLLGRNYSAAQAADFASSCRTAGFDNISLDLMIGVPTEDRKSLEENLHRLADLQPEHVSLYIMEQLESLPFEQFYNRHAPDEDAVADEYAFLQENLEARGLLQYEISNFSRPGKECRHNLKYWRYEPFLGLGPSACSHMGSRRWCHEPDIRAWAEVLHSGKAAVVEAVDLSPDESLKEALIFGLRLVEGIKPSEFQNRFGVNVLEHFGPSFRELESKGLIELSEDSVRIPRDKLLVSNQVFIKFV